MLTYEHHRENDRQQFAEVSFRVNSQEVILLLNAAEEKLGKVELQ